MCYETSDLFYDVLLKLGFSCKRIKAYPLNGKPYNPNAPSSHNIIIADLNKKLFLIDVGYGNNSISVRQCMIDIIQKLLLLKLFSNKLL